MRSERNSFLTGPGPECILQAYTIFPAITAKHQTNEKVWKQDFKWTRQNVRCSKIVGEHPSTKQSLILFKASNANVSYPELPPVSPANIASPCKTVRRDTNIITKPSVQANIGCRRSTRLAALAHTPPRASGSEQMGNVFVQSVPKIPKTLVLESSGRRSRGDKTSTTFPRDRCDSVHGIAPSRAHEFHTVSSWESTTSSGTDDEDPLGDLERASAWESSASSARHSSSPPEDRPATASPGEIACTSNVPEDVHVSPPKTPAPETEESPSLENHPGSEVVNSVKTCSRQSTCSTSSEEWTGDEEFLPLSVRQRHRAQRLAYRQVLTSPQQESRFSAQARAALDWDSVRRLQQSSESSSKTSRFRKKGSVGGVLDPEATQEQKES